MNILIREDDNMKKNDLISGRHVVELEDGDKYLFLEGRFVNSRFWYDTDAKICKIFEIQEVYSLSDMLVFGKGLNLIWEIKPELSEVERVILENLYRDSNYITRDESGELWLFENRPIKKDYSWDLLNGFGENFNLYKHLFKMIKWEDEEPTLISDLLEVNNNEQ